MSASNNNQNEIISAWQNLIEQSVKANTEFLKESSKIFTDILSKKFDAKDLFKINNDVLNAAAGNFIKLNISNTENLVNFGVNLSKSIFSFIDKNNKTDINTGQQPVTQTHNTRGQINLSVKQGENISTSFYLNSHNAFSQTGKFYYDNFINIMTGQKADLSLSISPKEFILEPAKSVKVDVNISASKDIIPGTYKITVRLDGMDNQEFDIVAEVLENKTSIKQISKPKRNVKSATPKKVTLKKAAVKRKK